MCATSHILPNGVSFTFASMILFRHLVVSLLSTFLAHLDEQTDAYIVSLRFFRRDVARMQSAATTTDVDYDL